jgi:hypothetical protein
VEVTLAGHAAYDGQGQKLDQQRFDFDELALMQTMLGNYYASLITPQDHAFASTGKANLGLMAVMQAAYLSSRTGTPEDPERVLGRLGR